MAALKGALDGARVLALDASLFIYLVEKHPVFHAKVAPIFAALDAGEVRGVTSTLTLLEVLVKPFESGATALIDTFRIAIMRSPHLQVVPVETPIAELAAMIRAERKYRTPDAIHLATAQHAGADAFVTNDARLASFAGVRVVGLDALP